MRDKFRKKGEDNRLEFVTHEGHTYLAPVGDKDGNKINGIRRWDQAFRVYAAIFCKGNPTHAAEIWQYTHTINMAASSYTWDNVAYYDYTFRQMMSVNPNRSWGKTFGQLWSLSMTNPIQCNGNYQGQQGFNSGYSRSGQKSNKTQGNSKRSGGARPCWKFNKNQPCNGSCRFDHKCSYCGAKGHSVLDCNKLHSKSNDKNDKK